VNHPTHADKTRRMSELHG